MTGLDEVFRLRIGRYRVIYSVATSLDGDRAEGRRSERRVSV